MRAEAHQAGRDAGGHPAYAKIDTIFRESEQA
jgi:hypothetical protein